mmetsp:Transcript_16182/g.40703  ORF Transcript_16182/g.40703 Transcript_16182/m.40703 type:complete len:206 (-) Transcript_16182:545-1162(-)
MRASGRRAPVPNGVTGPPSFIPTFSLKLPMAPMLPGLCATSASPRWSRPRESCMRESCGMFSQRGCCESFPVPRPPSADAAASWLRGVVQSESDCAERSCDTPSLCEGSSPPSTSQPSKLHCAPSYCGSGSPQESEPEGCEEFIRSEAVLSSLMGEGRCHGEEPRLPSRLPSARRWWTAAPPLPLPMVGCRCGVCAATPPAAPAN